MKNLTITIAALLLSTSLIASTPEPKLWNNLGKEFTFKRGDIIKIKSGSNSAKYVLAGKVEAVCNSKYIKVDGYFVAIKDVEVITKYNTVR